jgi:hypothetical protein
MYFSILMYMSMKSLKTAKGSSESISRRRTDNTMTKKKEQMDKQRSTKHYTENRISG